MIFFAATLISSAKIAIAQIEIAKREAEEVSKMPPEMQERYWQIKKEAQREYDIERRHRELCSAIRSTSFWRFGS